MGTCYGSPQKELDYHIQSKNFCKLNTLYRVSHGEQYSGPNTGQPTLVYAAELRRLTGVQTEQNPRRT